MEAVAKPFPRRASALAALVIPLLVLGLLFYHLDITHAQAPLPEILGIHGGVVYDATIDPLTGRAYLVTPIIPGIYWSDDNGNHWQVDPDSRVGGGGSIEIGPDGALYATVPGGFLRSTDGGQTWNTLADASSAHYASTIQGSDIDPNDLNHMLIATGSWEDNDGTVYYTLDGAETWITATLSISATADAADVAIDPIRTGVAYATSNDFWYPDTPSYIYRSTDGGLSFTPVFTAPAGVQFQDVGVNAHGTVYAGSSMGVFRSENGIDWNFTAVGGKMVSFGVNDPDTIYVDYAVSLDNGFTWHPSQISSFVAESSANPDLIFTAGPIGIQRSLDGGSTWEDCVTGIDTIEILALTSDPFDNQILYAATNQGAARSMDGGNSWQFPLGNLNYTIHDIAVDASQSGVLYLGASDGRVYKSTDYGQTFTIPKSPVKTKYAIKDLLVNPWRTKNLYAATLMPTDTDILYGGLFRSEDFGTSWLTITMKAKQVNTVQAGPLITNTVLYAGLGDYWQGVGLEGGGVYRSLDGGKSWLSVGMKNKVVTSLAVHPRDGRIVYAGMGTAFDSGYSQYLYWSHDMGENWGALPLDIESFSVDLLNVDVNDPRTVYACTQGEVFISTDSGRTWSLFYKGQPGEQIKAVYTPLLGPEAVQFLEPELSENNIQLQWEIPGDRDIVGVNLRVLTTTFPTAHTLGISLTNQTAVPGTTGSLGYTKFMPGDTYYFTAFSYDQSGHFSAPAYLSVTVPSANLNTLHFREFNPFSDTNNASVASAPALSLNTRVVYLATSKGLFRYTLPGPAGIQFLPFVRK